MRYMVNVVETYRVDSENDVKDFIEEQKEQGKELHYEVTGYSSTLKEKKKKGEVVDSAYLVKINKAYNPFWPEFFEE